MVLHAAGSHARQPMSAVLPSMSDFWRRRQAPTRLLYDTAHEGIHGLGQISLCRDGLARVEKMRMASKGKQRPARSAARSARRRLCPPVTCCKLPGGPGGWPPGAGVGLCLHAPPSPRVGGHSAADIAKRGSAELYTRPPRTQVARC